MDTTLVTVTVLSMGMAAALSVIVWRLLRDERRRSEARVAALTAAAPPRSAGLRDTGLRDAGLRDAGHRETRVASGFRRNDTEIDLPLRHDSAVATSPVMTGPMFVETVQPTPWWNRAFVMAAIALLGTAAVLFALAASKNGSPRSAAPPTAAASPAADAAPGLELLSLRDSRTADALTITGMVRNPRGAALRSRVAVTAYAFDDKGAFLASGRALLDVTSLAAGDESPFVVSVPVTEAVARYRIGFRGEDGRVIAHVDKRQAGPIAALYSRSDQVNR